MKEVNVYIELMFSGKFNNGFGKYSIVLEIMVEDIPKTKVHYGECENITNHRLAITACIDALQKFKEPCKINIHMNAPYVVATASRSDKSICKNEDLWQQYDKMAKDHQIEVIQEQRNSYSPAMRLELKKREVEKFKEGIQNGKARKKANV